MRDASYIKRGEEFMTISISKNVSAIVVGISLMSFTTGGTSLAAERTYYYASQVLGHPYLLDIHLGMRYAAEKLGVKIVTVGPQDWDPAGHAAAVEQAIPKKPDGIITSLWEPGAIPAIKKAMKMGIPVMVIEASVPDSGALGFIGVDNYDMGQKIAKELVSRAGNDGDVVVSGNWGASNTDEKYRGFEDFIKANTKWNIIAKIDDKATTATATATAKTVLNTYPKMKGFVGLNANTGTGFCLAAKELGVDVKPYTVVVNDREQVVLDCIKSGEIDASVATKTALQAYLAIELLEKYNEAKGTLKNVPITKDNQASNVSPMPEKVLIGSIVISKENVDNFMHANIPQYK